MSNHVHYLIEPKQPEDLPKIMHFLNWYTALCALTECSTARDTFGKSAILHQGFSAGDKDRALNTLRYIHGNPKAAKMRSTFFYEFSNYGSYEKLTSDGLTQWHPAFLQLGTTLEDCDRKYRGFCNRYKTKSKPAKKCHWVSQLLAGMERPSSSRDQGKRGRGSYALSATTTACQVRTSPRYRQLPVNSLRQTKRPGCPHEKCEERFGLW